MIPFQRQVYEALKRQEAEQRREQMPNAGGSRPQKNSLAGSGGKTQSKSETIRYESDGDNNEANTSFVD